MQHVRLNPLFSLLIAVLLTSSCFAKTSGLIRVSAIHNNAEPSFFDKGTGILRSDGSDFQVSQGIVIGEYDIGKNLMFHGVANAYSDGYRKAGITQAYVEYRPLSAKAYKWSSRAGFFYPRLSVENTDVAWLATHFITSSAINSWIGEELRVPGLEVSVRRSGRQFRSPWSFRFDMGAFRGNDTTGTLLTWRGFSIHDRQTLHHERIEFAPLPSVIGPETFSAPSWTVPFTEIDGKVGFYMGLQAQYLRNLDVRYFYYDNRADPQQIDERRLYAWHTKFHSLAARYLLTKNTELSLHVLDGSTEMGARLVYADFSSIYAAISHTIQQHKVSLRLDIFDVTEDDRWPQDYNDSHGLALTANWTYSWSPSWQFAAEALVSKNYFENRPSVGVLPTQEDAQGQLALTYRF